MFQVLRVLFACIGNRDLIVTRSKSHILVDDRITDMPFTPFHLCPALAIGLPLKRAIHAPTFALANIALDVEPLLVLLLGLNHPLHGLTHTLLAAFLVGVGLAYVCASIEGVLSPVHKVLLLESTSGKMKLKSFLIAGVLGTISHVMLDSPLYDDIHPLFPLAVNPFYDPALALSISLLCSWMGIFAVIYYVSSAAFKAYRSNRLPTRV